MRCFVNSPHERFSLDVEKHSALQQRRQIFLRSESADDLLFSLASLSLESEAHYKTWEGRGTILCEFA